MCCSQICGYHPPVPGNFRVGVIFAFFVVEWDINMRKFMTHVHVRVVQFCPWNHSHSTCNSYPAKAVTNLQGPTLFPGLACCCPCLVSRARASPLPLAMLVRMPIMSVSITIITHKSPLRLSQVQIIASHAWWMSINEFRKFASAKI